MISIGQSGIRPVESAADLSALRVQFQEQHYVKLPKLLDPDLLRFVQSHLDKAKFYARVHNGIGSNKELCLQGNAAFGALLFAVNDEKLFQIVESIAQCEPIRCFEGRVYRAVPGQGHYDCWHDDVTEHRLVGFSINLGLDEYLGGELQIRDRATQQILAEVSNTTPGDAVMFRLSSCLQHRITDVRGTLPKTAFAGWFRGQPSFLSLLRQQSLRAKENGRDIFQISFLSLKCLLTCETWLR